MSHFSSWNVHTLTTRRSPLRIHIRFLSLPGIRPSRLLPSTHITRTREAPSSWSAIPSISPSFVRGMRPRTTSSSTTIVSMEREAKTFADASLLEIDRVRDQCAVLEARLADRHVRGWNGGRLGERRADDVHTLGQRIRLGGPLGGAI